MLANAPNCYLSLVLASVVQGDAVNCNTSIHTVMKWCSSEANVNVCLSDLKPELIGIRFHKAISYRLERWCG